MDDDDDDDDDRSRRTNGRAPALPQILRQWATHHVGAFVEDADSSEHILSSDYDGNALGAEARRAIHEEARRRGVRAKSVDLANGTRAVALTRRANEDEDEDEDGDETAAQADGAGVASTTRTIPRRTTERTKRTRGRESWSGTLICERHRSTCTPNLRFQRTIRIPLGERQAIIAKPSSGIPITRRRRRAGRVERAGACCSLSDGFVRDRRRIM